MGTIYTKLSFILIIVCFFACDPNYSKKYEPSLTELKIYDCVIKRLLKDCKKHFELTEYKGTQIFIIDSSYIDLIPLPDKKQRTIVDEVNSWKSNYSEEEFEILLNYAKNNLSRYQMDYDKLESNINYRSFPLDSIYIMNSQSGGIWWYLKKQHPNFLSFVRFSRIGFNADKNRAYLEMYFMFGPKSGEGGSIFLRCSQDEWFVEKWEQTFEI
jgi:hypothetical protein